MAPDSRRVVGGFVWAKSTTVSNDSRRIYGVEADKQYLRGTVLEVLTHRPEGARRATTLIKAKFIIGNDIEKVKVINLAQLKKENPSASVPPAVATTAPAVATTAAATAATSTGGSPQNLEQSSTTTSVSTPTTDTTTTAGTAVAPGTSQTAGSGDASTAVNSTASSVRLPVVECHGNKWFEGNTELPTNGNFVHKTWKLTCQYSGTDVTPGCDLAKQFSPLDFFMAVFPKKQLSMMVEETSAKLQKEGKPRLTKGELLKWIGVLVLITRFEFGE